MIWWHCVVNQISTIYNEIKPKSKKIAWPPSFFPFHCPFSVSKWYKKLKEGEAFYLIWAWFWANYRNRVGGVEGGHAMRTSGSHKYPLQTAWFMSDLFISQIEGKIILLCHQHGLECPQTRRLKTIQQT